MMLRYLFSAPLVSTPLVLACSLAFVACGPSGRTGGARGGGQSDASTATGTGGFNPGETGQTGGGGDTEATGEATGGGSGGETEGGSGTGEVPPPPQFDGIAGFASPELFLQIVGPESADHVVSSSGVTYIAGLLFGHAEKIVWQSSTGDSGEADGNRFWETGPIALAPGDNLIVVRAINEAGTESVDTITVTYNPGFSFADRPVARPASFFTGEAVDVVVSIGIRTKNILGGSVTLWEVDDVGNTIGQIGKMVDNGDTTNPSCDEIQDDGVYSICASLESPLPTMKHLRVSLQVQVQGALYTVFSPLVPVEIVDPIAAGDCEDMRAVLVGAREAFEGASGSPNPGAAALSYLQASALVASAGTNAEGLGVWVAFKSGILGAVSLSKPGTRGGGDGEDGGYATLAAPLGNVMPIESKNVLALAPNNATFGPTDEVPQIVAGLEAQQCPEFTVDGPYLNSDASLARLRKAYEYGILIFSGHADAYFSGLDSARKRDLHWEHDGSQEILWTGDAVQCGQLQSAMTPCSDDSQCQGYATCEVTQSTGATTSGLCIDKTSIDLRRGRVIMGDATWGVHPEFFTHHRKRRWPSSLVYLGACKTLYSGTLAGALFGAGAKAIAGYTGYVTSKFASEQSREWFSQMLSQKKLAGYATLFPVADPQNQNAHFGLFGGTNVEITDAKILNAGFETGEVTGWNVEGDGRVISQLGVSIPVGGKFMGILSTGLGYTQQTGELSQSFCIPETATEMRFFWKFFSEEFVEYCGSVYQDAFQATLETAGGKQTVVDVTVDDLCKTTECSGCGAQYVGLIPSDVSFDQGGVYNTQWQEELVNVSSFAGKLPVTLRLFTTDAGDSIYDTVILVDSIQFD